MDQSISFLGVCIFYDRRELFCPRILSFRSGSCWVRLIFSGSLKKRLTREKENSHQLGFATSKAHKRETQGKYFYLVFFSKDFIKIFSLDFKISASLVIRICLEGNTMRNRGAYSTKERMPSDIERPSTNQPGRLYMIGGVLPSRQ